MTDGTATDEHLGDLPHLDGGLHAGVNVHFFERVLKGQRVDDCGEHAHVIGRNAVKPLSAGCQIRERCCRRR